ncbi:hypothetical protein QEH59_08715 [Coraliomargarita sp. SDUM461004]|uniref:Uncharacterized protein n=1 Tax=Thalassobacterium sedimentorum TaxID=3041258 RepID=A0ABU1AI61_9BACT|nr:hypothetical protein [Coraliomargarita sp. SDUM461004]MDQ8194507.1 hypothetical protein [Coraliomargarita sp. SDUM461004]
MKNLKSKTRSSAMGLVIGALLTSSTMATAASRLSESFSAVGTVPDDWKVVQRLGLEVPAIVEVGPMKPDGTGTALMISRPGAVASNAAVFFEGSVGNIRDGKLDDLYASVLIRFTEARSGSNSRGIVLRADTESYGNFGGYYIAVIPRNNERGIGIFKNPLDHVDNGEMLAFTALKENLSPYVDYSLRVKAVGQVIEASISEESGISEIIASVRIDEATKTKAGLFGLRAGHTNSGPVTTYFHQLHFSQIK